MKKNYIFKFLLLIIPVSAFLMMSSSGGRNDGRSGSPGDNGNTCASCHNGGNFNASVDITTNIPSTGYLLNTDYTINVNTTSSSSTHGFQLAAENSSNNKVGTFLAGSGSRVNSDRITHTTPSNSGDWSFTWKSPATDLGRVTFYAAVNAANGNGSAFDGLDQTVTSTSTAPSLSISEAQLLDFDMYPNPSKERLTIQLPSNTGKAEVHFYNYIGKLAMSKTISLDDNKIDVKELSAGVYILKVITEDKIGTQKFIKE